VKENTTHTKEDLKMMQSLPLSIKVRMTEERIRQWYQHWGGQVCVSFSGGKDSTVLMEIARRLYPDIPAVFSNTGLEYPEIQKFVREYKNVDIVTPKVRFFDVVIRDGYPLISKEVSHGIAIARKFKKGNENKHKREELLGTRYISGTNILSVYNKEKWLPLCTELPVLISDYCCDKIKKQPVNQYKRKHGYKLYLATLAEESMLRKQGWLKHGCNAYDSSDPKSQPMSFWTEQDVLEYIVLNGLEIASVYGDIVSVDEAGDYYSPIDLLGGCRGGLKCTGCERTGCIFCGYGFHSEKGETRFQRLARTHPKQYEYCIKGGKWSDNPYYDPTVPKMDGEWKNWNPKKIWTPSEKGLGMGKLFDMVNEIYGKDFYRYE